MTFSSNYIFSLHVPTYRYGVRSLTRLLNEICERIHWNIFDPAEYRAEIQCTNRTSVLL